jgi:hypothetical protein
MCRSSHSLVIRVVGTFTCLLAVATARPAAAQEPRPTPPAPSFADLVPPEQAVQPEVAAPPYYAGDAYATTSPIVVTGPIETIYESICGKPDPNTWRPLTIHTLFS